MPCGERCCSAISELFQNFDRLPRVWCWRRMWRRVDMLQLIGAQIVREEALQSSIVLGYRGWPDKKLISNFMRLGKSHWPVPVCSCIHLGISSVAS